MAAKSVDQIRLMSVILGMAALGPIAALAEENGQAKAREVRQDARIEEGVKSGAINETEARRIGHQQHRIDRMEKRSEKDGVVTSQEAHRIDRVQNQASRRIYRAKHNRR